MSENLDQIYFFQNKTFTRKEDEYQNTRKNIEKDDLLWQKLNGIIREISAKEKEENQSLLIDLETGRLDSNQYHETYGKNNKHYSKEVKEGIEETLREYTEKWYNSINQKEELENYIKNILKGEKAELFILINLYKFLKEDFIIVRSSYYDDVDNGVDTIILDKQSGNIVCALDESSSFSINFDEKKKKILEKNLKGGARLQYGLQLEKQNNKTIIKGTPVKNIPLFYLPIDINEIEENLKLDEFKLDEITDVDRKTFYFLMTNIIIQAEDFETLSASKDIHFPQELVNKTKNFIGRIKKLYPNISFKDSPKNSLQKGPLSPVFYTSKNQIPLSEIDKYRVKNTSDEK
ncbi:MAG: hypothetical protein ACPLW7_03105 [Minisyncoccia bacterium]